MLTNSNRTQGLASTSDDFTPFFSFFSMLNYLTSLGSHLHQIYVLEATLQYVLREYNRIQDQIKFEPPDSPIREKLTSAAKKLIFNINCIRKAMNRVKYILKKVRTTIILTFEIFRRFSLSILHVR